MIPLIVLAAVLGLWAAIATGIAVSKDELMKGNVGIIARQRDRIDALEDRQQASSLGEYHAARVAMPAYTREHQEKHYRYDDTGLIRELVPPGEDDDVA